MPGSLKRVGDIWKFRLRMAMALRDGVPSTAASADELDRLVAMQIACWQGRPLLTGAAADRALHDLNDRSTSAFVFSIRGRKVRRWSKRGYTFTAADEANSIEEQRDKARRE